MRIWNKTHFFSLVSFVCVLILLHFIVEIKSSSQFYESGGRLTQIELALQASDRGGTILAVKSDRHIVIASWTPNSKEYEIKTSKIKRLSSSIATVASGIESDINYIINKFHDKLLVHEYVFGTEMRPIRLAKEISEYVHKHTVSSIYRPFGIRLCVFAYDDILRSTCLYEVDPYGYFHDCNMICFGPYSKKLMAYWPDEENMETLGSSSLNKLVMNIIKCLQKCISDSEEQIVIKSKDIEIVIVGENLSFSSLDQEIIRSIIESSNTIDVENKLQSISKKKR